MSDTKGSSRGGAPAGEKEEQGKAVLDAQRMRTKLETMSMAEDWDGLVKTCAEIFACCHGDESQEFAEEFASG